MKDKEFINGQSHGRPCFYSFCDKTNGLYWLIPISSQTQKFRQIYNQKLLKYGDVDTIVFGYVMGDEKAFLIQNMFPITDKYIDCVYIDNKTQKPVIINTRLNNELQHKANKVLNLQRKGYRLIFPDVLAIESKLLSNP
jgi:hypothetical protein